VYIARHTDGWLPGTLTALPWWLHDCCAQADLDLGNYERFLDVTLTRDNNLTTGKVYQVRSLKPYKTSSIVSMVRHETGQAVVSSCPRA
jgi:hypothetical protein